MTTSLLSCFPITHAELKPIRHPQLGVIVNNQTAVRYLRFGRRVRLDRLELPRAVYGRWVPNVPTHPAHLIISQFDSRQGTWQVVREVDLPYDPVTAGKNLSQRLTTEQMDAQLAKVLKRKPHVIPLGGLVTDHLRVECDREHPVWPSHGECNGGTLNVPFGILNPLQAFGQPLAAPPAATYLPYLRAGRIHPRAPRGMTLQQLPHQLLFAGRRFAVGFSLRRPLLLHLGWDALGAGRAKLNRLLASHVGGRSKAIGGLSGPTLRTALFDCQPHNWTGKTFVDSNRVSYRNLHCAHPDVELEMTFTVEPDRLLMQLRQHRRTAFHAIEAQAWRLVWNMDAAMTGAAAVPTLRPGRNGEVQLPMLWAGDGVGCLSCRTLAGTAEDFRMEVESYQAQNCVVGGLAFGEQPGEHQATVELAVTNLGPATPKRPSRAVQRHWGSIYSCFRPEFGGFSNHATSCNCHVNQHCPAELVAFTRPPQVGPHPLDLYRFTITRALLDGGGYGYWRNLYLDVDPILICGAGRIHQAQPDLAWLRQIERGVLATVKRILGTLGREHLVICRALSGNAGSYRWSSNAMDVIGFGHMDAYVNAWTYRGLRNATALLDDLGQHGLAQQCRERAAKLRTAFPQFLLNPKTGWVAGWRSRDGELHDYAFTWVNGVTAAFGLLDQPVARRALHGLEKLRRTQRVDSGFSGVPFNLWPIRRDDHMLPKTWGVFPTTPTFEFYTDGAMGAIFAIYYLRALADCGLRQSARKLANEMAAGYEAGFWTGGTGSGVEFRSWDGLCTGYEGTFVGNFAPLYGIAIEQGLIKPPTPEWWPAGG